MSRHPSLRTLKFAAGILRRRPFSVLVQVTNRCNMACPFCDFWPNGASPKEELRLADFEALAGALAAEGAFLVSIEGGEPLVRPDLVDIVRVFAERGHLPILYTNGWFIDAAKARALFAAGLHQVGVSIDFPDARHDEMRRTPGAFDRARAAATLLRTASAAGAAQVHLMTVVMRENQHLIEPLLELSAGLEVGHHLTLLSDGGFRRGPAGAHRPDDAAVAGLPALRDRHRHLQSFGSYLEGFPTYLDGGAALPRCRAGLQAFNLDHLGNVAPCIEKIDRYVGNVRDTPLPELLRRLREADAGEGCQACWTLCRGMAQALGEGGSLRDWIDLGARMRA